MAGAQAIPVPRGGMLEIRFDMIGELAEGYELALSQVTHLSGCLKFRQGASRCIDSLLRGGEEFSLTEIVNGKSPMRARENSQPGAAEQEVAPALARSPCRIAAQQELRRGHDGYRRQ